MQAAATSALSTAQRSHPTSEVRGRSWEDPMPEGRRPREVTPLLRSEAEAERSYLESDARGIGQGGATPHLRPGAVARRTNPTSKEHWLHRHRRA